jgi:hypothetical protein
METDDARHFYCAARLEFACVSLDFGVLLSLEFYCRIQKNVKNYLKYWGSIVGGVLLSLGFYGRHTLPDGCH